MLWYRGHPEVSIWYTRAQSGENKIETECLLLLHQLRIPVCSPVYLVVYLENLFQEAHIKFKHRTRTCRVESFRALIFQTWCWDFKFTPLENTKSAEALF